MLVRDVMSTPAVTVHPDAPLKEVARLLDQHGITALPVVDDHQRIVGVISEADVLRDALPEDPWATPLHTSTLGPYLTRVADVMSYHPVTVMPTTELLVATDLLVETTVKSLPVVEDGIVVGVVSRRDIVAVLARRDGQVAADMRELVGETGTNLAVDVEDGVVSIAGTTSESEREVLRVLAGSVAGAVAVRFVSS